MAEVTAALVKQLRDDTGLGMMDCKKALDETGGDIDAAKDLLRSKGMATAEKKAGRETSEGLVRLKVLDDGKTAVMVGVLCETDFCSRNEEFQQMATALLDLACEKPVGVIEADDAMTARLQETLAKIGENMSYDSGKKISGEAIGTYLHHNHKVGVIVALDKPVDEDTLTGLCQHIAFSDPMAITGDDIPADVMEREKKFAKQEAIDSGKPEEIAEKMVAGKIRKFIAQNALMEQAYVKDDKKSIREILGGATVVDFARIAIGQ